jgi:hypothetical protein
MSAHRTTWKRSESCVAALFGARRQVLSGPPRRDDATRSDSNHDRLFIECKYRERHAVRSLHDATRALARREGKVPVVALYDKGRPGCLLLIHSDDLTALVAEYARANASDGLDGAGRL